MSLPGIASGGSLSCILPGIASGGSLPDANMISLKFSDV